MVRIARILSTTLSGTLGPRGVDDQLAFLGPDRDRDGPAADLAVLVLGLPLVLARRVDLEDLAAIRDKGPRATSSTLLHLGLGRDLGQDRLGAPLVARPRGASGARGGLGRRGRRRLLSCRRLPSRVGFHLSKYTSQTIFPQDPD